ncbi:MAG: carboxylating nicotinate-nucleotide diphosphorylase [Aquificaceae bacterium]|nr:carboxylating nicotinate-nucleotide diphosphorylase [Aquificaceae bacterium]MDW8096770.1 carboxylating nicotinate-nucleotide diphosphorylase [Aquificaceae bacterium]
MVDKLLLRFLEEDVGHGDLTTEGVYRGERARAVVRTKERCVLAGVPFAVRVFELLGEVKVLKALEEGRECVEGEEVLVLEAPACVLLTGERVALNLLQRMSGIATLTRDFVKALEGTKTRLLDTRKTTPGMRLFEKHAVRVGGGANHRYALYDMVLIKDNHKAVCGSIEEAVRRVREKVSPLCPIEVEVENLQELQEALRCGVQVVMLDNFSPQEVREAVKLVEGRAKVEVSGGIGLDNIREYAVEGVDFVSVGAVTHSAKWVDMSMRLLPLR